jgi:recombinational DNA repair protein (RecF pathway)
LPDSATTRFLILRKSVYAESSLILAGISPDAGQLHFLVRGARRLGPRQFPVADLYRELAVQYRPGRGELWTWKSAEVLADCAGVARDPDAFAAAGWLAAFALGNIPAGMACPRIHAALLAALRRLATGPGSAEIAAPAFRDAAVGGVLFVFLEEHGWLPDAGQDPLRRTRRERLLQLSEGRAEPAPPDWTAYDWRHLRSWCEQALRNQDCHLPTVR